MSILYFYNAAKNKTLVNFSRSPQNMRHKILSLLRKRKHPNAELQADWIEDSKSFSFYPVFPNSQLYNSVWSPPRKIDVDRFWSYTKNVGDHIVWDGPSSIFDCSPSRIAYFIAGGIPLKGSRTITKCSEKKCLKLEHLELFVYNNSMQSIPTELYLRAQANVEKDLDSEDPQTVEEVMAIIDRNRRKDISLDDRFNREPAGE